MKPQASRRTSGQRPTMQDVADKACVSMTSVSRVLNNSSQVSSDVRARVQRAIQALNYVPNLAAKRLALRQHNRNIGFLFATPNAAVLGEMVSAGADEARSSGAELVFIKVSPDLSAMQIRKTIANFGIEGVILPPPLADDVRLRNALSADGIRLVTIAADENSSTHSSVRIDDRRAVYRLTRHLLEIGHRRIGFIGGASQHRSSARRRAGYEEALLEQGLLIDSSLYWEGEYTYASGLAAAEAALAVEPRPTAIFAGNDDMAAAVISVATKHGISVPGDLTVCGFDDSEIAVMVSPPLTTICQPVGAMVRWAINQLVSELSAIERSEQPEIRRVVVHHRIVHRGSEAPPKKSKRELVFKQKGMVGIA